MSVLRIILNKYPYINKCILFLLIIFLAYVVFIIAKKVVLKGLKICAKKTENKFDDIIIRRHVFDRLSYIAPAIVIYMLGHLIPELELWMQRFSMAYIILIILLVIDALINIGEDLYQRYEISSKKPIKGYIQGIKLIIYLVGAIFIIAHLLDKSPWGILSGIGAMTAVLMLVFKDTILSFMASIQISLNKTMEVGDWIEMPKYGVDGDLIEIALHTVKVRNWDKTIVTIPTQKFLYESFKNWRGMSESGGRRIKRTIQIDQSSIKFCTSEMLAKFKRIEYLKDYLKIKEKEIVEYNKERNIDDSVVVNGRKLTNIGTFRAYIEKYLRNHPKVHKGLTLMVRQLQPGPEGLPIQIYCFTNDTRWVNYENIQANIFDHILAIVPEFSLKVFQNPGGSDFQKIL